MDKLAGRNVVVLGLGQTGLSLVRWLVRRGAQVRVADTREHPPFAGELAERWPGVPLETGPFVASTFAGCDMIAISPGVAKDQPAIREAVAAGAELVGDIELFARALPQGQKLLAITGTNGKSTVTTLAGELARAAGLDTVVAGNIGAAVLDVLATLEDEQRWPDLVVLELSSFQLETTTSLKPTAATVLNVAPNHLDRYAGLADYASAKASLFTHASVLVLNRDDAIVRLMRRPGRTVQTFGASVPLSEEEWGLVGRGGRDWLARGGELIAPLDALALLGRHNGLNALAALALVSSVAKLTPPVIAALSTFAGLPHRVQRVAEHDGVVFVDDSKATTVAATEAALAGIGRPAVLIAGGDGKGQSFVPLKPAVDKHCRAVLLIGRDAPAVAHGLAGTSAQLVMCCTLEQAVAKAFEVARPGDAVLLSPACASLDQFPNYNVRGDRFAALVRQRLAEAQACGSA